MRFARQFKLFRHRIAKWVTKDYSENPKRFFLEITAWILCVGNALTMAITVPNPPLFPMYISWIVGYMIYSYCAWSRRSFGLFVNFIFLFLIDVFGFWRVIITM